MKKLTISLLLIIQVFLVINCQYWAPKGTSWFYDQDIYLNESHRSYIKMMSLGDTVLNGDTLTKISESTPQYENFRFFYTKFANNKVYYFHESENQFKLLYDFNAEKGDTVKVYCRQSDQGTNPYAYIKIDSVTFTIIGSNTLRTQHFSNITSTETSCQMMQDQPIIERIGHLKFMFPQHSWADPPYGGYLRCYEDSILGLQKYSTKECDYYITSMESQSFSFDKFLYPNPCKTELIFTLDGIQKISVFDYLGKTTLTSNEINIKKVDVSSLNNGLYFILVETIDGKLFNERFIKTE